MANASCWPLWGSLNCSNSDCMNLGFYCWVYIFFFYVLTQENSSTPLELGFLGHATDNRRAIRRRMRSCAQVWARMNIRACLKNNVKSLRSLRMIKKKDLTFNRMMQLLRLQNSHRYRPIVSGFVERIYSITYFFSPPR